MRFLLIALFSLTTMFNLGAQAMSQHPSEDDMKWSRQGGVNTYKIPNDYNLESIFNYLAEDVSEQYILNRYGRVIFFFHDKNKEEFPFLMFANGENYSKNGKLMGRTPGYLDNPNQQPKIINNPDYRHDASVFMYKMARMLVLEFHYDWVRTPAEIGMTQEEFDWYRDNGVEIIRYEGWLPFKGDW